MVKPTIYAAIALDYPKDKLSIHVLDDGRRPEFKAFCEEIGDEFVENVENFLLHCDVECRGRLVGDQ